MMYSWYGVANDIIYSTCKKTFNGKLFDLYVDKYTKQPYNLSERDSYIRVLEQFRL